MKKDAIDAQFGARLIYYTQSLFIYGILLLYDNDLKLEILALDLKYPLLLIVFIISATYLLHISGQNPGYTSYEIQKSEVELEATKSDQDSHSTGELEDFSIFVFIKNSKVNRNSGDHEDEEDKGNIAQSLQENSDLGFDETTEITKYLFGNQTFIKGVISIMKFRKIEIRMKSCNMG